MLITVVMMSIMNLVIVRSHYLSTTLRKAILTRLTLILLQDSMGCEYSLKDEHFSDTLRRQEHQSCQLKNYKLNYALYELPATADVDPYK